MDYLELMVYYIIFAHNYSYMGRTKGPKTKTRGLRMKVDTWDDVDEISKKAKTKPTPYIAEVIESHIKSKKKKAK